MAKLKIKNHPQIKSASTDPDREPYDPFKHGVSMSCLNLWLECRESCRLKYVHGIKPDRTSNAFIQGDINAQLQEVFYKGLRAGEFEDRVDAAHAIGRKAAQIEKEALKKSGSNLQNILDALAVAEVLIPQYVNHYWEEDSGKDWNLVEDFFEVPLQTVHGEIVLKGAYDGGFLSKGKQWLFETKFKARWADSFVAALQIDLQITIYMRALEVLGEGPPAGCLYNLVRKPGLRMKKTERKQEFHGRILEDVVARPDHYFERHKIQFTPGERKMHSARLVRLVEEFLSWWTYAVQDRGQSPLENRDPLWNSQACDGKYGACRHLDICANRNLSGYTGYCI